MLDLPDLTRLERVQLTPGGNLVVTVLETEPDRCDDDDCTQEHRMVTRSVSRTVEGTTAALRALAARFTALADERQETGPTVPESGGCITEYLHPSRGWLRCTLVAEPRAGFFTVDLGRTDPSGGMLYDVPWYSIRRTY